MYMLWKINSTPQTPFWILTSLSLMIIINRDVDHIKIYVKILQKVTFNI